MSGVGEKRSSTSAEESPAKRVKQSYETSPEFLANLVHVKVDVPRTDEEKIFFCMRDDKLVDVWKGMAKRNVLSVPVLQKTKMKYYGFIDLADIVRHVVRHFADHSLDAVEDWWAWAETSEEIQKVLVSDVMKTPLTRLNPFHPVSEEYSLLSATEAMARESHLHRVPVLNNHKDRRLVSIVTQSQLAKVFVANIDTMGEKAKKPVAECVHTSDVIQVHESELAIDAFHKMTEAEVSGVAVTDTDGKLVGNLSVRDLKCIHTDARVFWRLYHPLSRFLQFLRAEFQKKHGIPREPVSATLTDTLEMVLRKVVAHHVHRVFIVDDAERVIGVMSIKDVLLEVLQ